MKNIGVLMSGCGHLDGSEIREAVLTLLALEENAAKKNREIEITIMAPNRNQYHVVDHLNGRESGEVRNVLVESARLARGKIKDVLHVDPTSLDGLLLPGGYGAAKNLSNWAFKGSTGEIIPEVADFILKIHQHQKPIGAICISPAVLSLLLGKREVKVTVGNDKITMEEIRKTGAETLECGVKEYHYDQNLKVYSTPAYMYGEATTFEVYQGISSMVEAFLRDIF